MEFLTYDRKHITNARDSKTGKANREINPHRVRQKQIS